MDLREYIQTGAAIKRHPWELARLKMLRFFIRKTVADKKLIADVGSGDAFLAGGVAVSWPESNVVAADINYDQALLQKLQEHKPVNLHFTNDIISINSAANLSAIVLMDVLEHVEHPENLLKDLLQLEQTDNNTVFIITVPAYQSLFSQHDINLGHYKRYTRASLEALLKPLSLQVLHSGYCFNSLLPVRRLQVKREKKKGPGISTNEGIHNWKGGAFRTKLLTTLLWIEFKITWYLARIGLKIPGLTCYCICKPSPS